MTQELTGNVAVVTGAGSGIGRAIAVAFAGAGIKVALGGRRRDKLDETASLIRQKGGESLITPVDVTDPILVSAMVDRVLDRYGQIDVLCNNAGLMSDIGPLWDVDLERWWAAVEVNLRGTMICTNAVLPHMMERDSGIIINMSGGGSTSPLPGVSGYGCSKAAVLRLTDTLAAELAKVGSAVKVYAVDPGFNPTEMTYGVAQHENAREWTPFVHQRLSTGEGHQPEECANMSLELVRLAPDVLCGRTIIVGDDIQCMANRGAEIKEGDLRTLRLRPLA